MLMDSSWFQSVFYPTSASVRLAIEPQRLLGLVRLAITQRVTEVPGPKVFEFEASKKSPAVLHQLTPADVPQKSLRKPGNCQQSLPATSVKVESENVRIGRKTLEHLSWSKLLFYRQRSYII